MIETHASTFLALIINQIFSADSAMLKKMKKQVFAHENMKKQPSKSRIL